MKIGLIYPTVTNKSTNIPDEHLGIGYIAAVLIQHGYDANILHYNSDEISARKMAKRILDEGYDVIGLSTYYHNYQIVSHLFVCLRALSSDIFIFLGGYLPTLSYDLIKEDLSYVNCYVLGEGEITCLELVDKLYHNEKWKDIDGIAYRKEGKICVSRRREVISNLDTLPFPKRTVFDKRTAMIASRGCYGHCNFCGIQEFYMKSCGQKAKVRRRSPENVIDEIVFLQKNYGTEIIDFYDDNFEISTKNGKAWFEQFFSLIKEKKIKIKFICNFRANEIVNKSEFLLKFKEIGLCSVFVGVESFTDRQLKFFGKMVTAQQNIEALNLLEEIGMEYQLGILLFEPTTTISELLENIRWIEKIKDSDNFNHMAPLSVSCTVIPTPDTELYSFVEENNLLDKSRDWGYRFMDPDVQLCHEQFMQLAQRVKYFADSNGKIVYLENRKDENMVKYMRTIYKKLFLIEIEALEKLAKMIQEGKKEKSCLDNFLHKEFEKLNILKTQLDAIEV